MMQICQAEHLWRGSTENRRLRGHTGADQKDRNCDQRRTAATRWMRPHGHLRITTSGSCSAASREHGDNKQFAYHSLQPRPQTTLLRRRLSTVPRALHFRDPRGRPPLKWISSAFSAGSQIADKPSVHGLKHIRIIEVVRRVIDPVEFVKVVGRVLLLE